MPGWVYQGEPKAGLPRIDALLKIPAQIRFLSV